MIELPNPFDYNSGADQSSGEPNPTPSPTPLIRDEAAESFPRGFDPQRFLTEIESPSTTPLLDPQFAHVREVETMIIEALARLSGRS